MPDYGVELFKNRRWAPQLKISGINAPAEEYMVDPALPPLGMDPRYPTTDQIVIPRGRLVAMKPLDYTYEGKAIITLADGVNNKPAGYTEANILRQHPQRIQIYPHVSKQEFIEVPYVLSVNDAYGQLKAGDRITAYYGSALSTTPNPMDKGRIVKWVPRGVASHTLATPSNTVFLTAANLAPFPPVSLLAITSAGAPITTTPTASWDATSGCWKLTFGGGDSVKVVLYAWGQHADQIAGEVVRVEPISSTHMLHGWLQWVTDNFAAWDYPPLAIRVPTTDVSNETPTPQSDGSYRLANRPIAVWKPIKVEIKGSYVTETGAIVNCADWTEMPLQDVPYQNWTWGKYHQIDPWLGILTFSNNVTVTDVRVSYSYETSYRDGRLWASGIYGLTDGSQSGIPGTPAHLDVPNLAGSLRVIIY